MKVTYGWRALARARGNGVELGYEPVRITRMRVDG